MFPTQLYAQSETIKTDSCTSVNKIEKKNLFTKVMDYFNDYDTTYIAPNKYNFAFMLDHYTNFEFYTIRGDKPHRQKINFTPKPNNKIGFYFGWQIFFVGWSIDIHDIFNHSNKKDRGTDFELSLYSSKIGVDLFYRRTSNSYKINHLRGFPEDVPRKFSVDFDGLKVDMKGINLYYVLNNKHFSYPAAFSQSTNQRRSAGSFIAGMAFSTHKLNFDYNKLPLIIQENMDPEMKVSYIKYRNYGINFGYAYNWVFARNFLACLSFCPELAYTASKIENIDKDRDKWYNRIKPDFIMRAALVYNNSKYYAGASFVGRTFDFSKNNFKLNNGYGTLQVYAGLNFSLKKEYRHLKKQKK